MTLPHGSAAMMDASVHSGEDVILTAAGLDRVHGSMENTDVLRVITDALGLGADIQ
ncbi:MAG: hypothetical protein QM576_12410 [Rhodopseudomonas sp.]|uniref:hypothetical protein n=1 Tax=Rhodopseudomonas sp. TaxID=1078 RepID=UPI0039E494EF